MTEAFCENPRCAAFGISLIVAGAANQECRCRRCGWPMTVVPEEEEEG